MGVDFSRVKVHTDAKSDQLNRSIQAKAFTTGQDVFFRHGAYDPSSRGGQELIAHELTHVVQQGSASHITQVQSKENQESEISIFSFIKGQDGSKIQRYTDMVEDDWTRERAAYFMMHKQQKEDGTADLDGQNRANSSVWYNTMFSPGLAQDDPNYDADQERVLEQQQAMLKRHFLAQAVFGVQGGNQFKKGEKRLFGPNRPDTPESYQPIEKFQRHGVSSNLSTLASGGGRFNYRSEDGSGEKFNSFLFFGNSTSEEALGTARSPSRGNRREGMPTSHMGAYKRIGTHGESFTNGHIRETDVTTGGIDSTGFDIPIGGVGQQLTDAKGRGVTTGYQGVSDAQQRSKNAKTRYQTGHGFHRFAQDEEGRSLTQIAFEGSGPSADNIHGGSHGIIATIKKKTMGAQSEKTLTGQDKRSKLNLPGGVGGVKADVTAVGMQQLVETNNILEKMRQSKHPGIQALEKHYYKMILASTTQHERVSIIEHINYHYGEHFWLEDAIRQKNDEEWDYHNY